MNFESIILLVLFLFFVTAIYFAIAKKWISLMGLLIISFGLGAFTVLYGTLWFPYKIVMIPIFLYTIFRLKFTSVNLINTFLIIVVISLIIAILTSPAVSGMTFLQGPIMRPFVQLYTYAGMALLIPFIVFIIDTPEKIQTTFKLYFRLSEIVIAIGIIHLIFIILGWDFLPILRSGGTASSEAAFGFEGIKINRIYGLSGEPKTLATFVLPYLFISFYNYIENNININKIYHISFIIASVLVIIYTFSSAILISGAICVILIPYLFRNRIKSGLVRIFAILVFGGVIISEVNKMFVKQDFEDEKERYGLLDIVYERSFGRVETEVEKRYESIALDYIFKEKPAFLLTGFGMGMYNYHLPMPKHGRGVEPIDSGWVVILMDFGFLGLLFFIILFRFVLKMKRDNRQYFDDNVMLNSFLIGAIVGFTGHIGNSALYQIFLFSGLSLAVINVLKNEQTEVNNEINVINKS